MKNNSIHLYLRIQRKNRSVFLTFCQIVSPGCLVFVALIGMVLSCGTTKIKPGDESWAFSGITKLTEVNPVLVPDRDSRFRCPVRNEKVRWEEKDVFNPAAVVKDNRVWLLYRAQDKLGWPAGTSRIGLAKSKDGKKFKREDDPVLYPQQDAMIRYEWEGGCEDPRIVQRKDGLYIMTYTAYDGRIARLCLASSKDLVTWQKHGLVLGESRYRDTWSKSGAIICERDGEAIVAKKIKGKYYMYWGDTDLFMATSTDLIVWEPVEDRRGNLVKVLSPRPGYFDSALVESGPFALWRKEGILLLYNSMNSASSGDKTMGAGTYTVGQALFSKRTPGKLLARTQSFCLSPDADFEVQGQVNNVCFLEGMVWFDDQWLLYYGAADSKIGVAVCRMK